MPASAVSRTISGILPLALLVSVLCPLSGADAADIDPVHRASLHPLTYDRPAPDFFAGAVLGNGGMGVIVCTRPDGIVFRFGHNDVWDIRVAEDNREKIGTFQDVFDRVAAIPDTLNNLTDDPWFREYLTMARENYAKPYPRPFPCGTVLLWLDPRTTEVLGHSVDPSTGLCTVRMLHNGAEMSLEVFADMTGDHLWARTVDIRGIPTPSPFRDITVIPDPDTPEIFPEWTESAPNVRNSVGFRQVLPFTEVTEDTKYRPHPKDRAFSLTAAVGDPFRSGRESTARFNPDLGPIASVQAREINRMLDTDEPFVMRVTLTNGLAAHVTSDDGSIPPPDSDSYDAASRTSTTVWDGYWRKSGIALADPFLERIWYHNLYFLRCALREGATCPGLFANWSYRSIGTAWHGDYHMNYNTQQPFWAVFATNHPELHLPYTDMVETYLLPVSQAWARDYYGMRGAFFPHSAYPVEMTLMPYPLPTWGWEVFETPWTVQSYWWHYLYTGDEDFLRDRAFPVMKEAVLFLVDYMMRPAAYGEQWGDDEYHIFPTVPPELYGLQPGFDKNHDSITDLTLTRFVFEAWLEASEILDREGDERQLMTDVSAILAHFPDIPTAQSQRGQVFVSVEGEDPEIVYNCPTSLMSVFPGEEHGLHSPPDILEIAVNTYRNHRNEGGNDLVFMNLQAARLGVLDLDRFRRHIRYSLLPNGTCADLVRQIHGRYVNTKPFDFMAGMGIWFENFGLPVVIAECLLQSYSGELRLFPNWPESLDASFQTLRAAGAFLVSAEQRDGTVATVEIMSEKGGTLRLVNPWDGAMICERAGGTTERHTGTSVTIPTAPGETIVLRSE
jgi:alpha-L-fucosidase 2